MTLPPSLHQSGCSILSFTTNVPAGVLAFWPVPTTYFLKNFPPSVSSSVLSDFETRTAKSGWSGKTRRWPGRIRVGSLMPLASMMSSFGQT